MAKVKCKCGTTEMDFKHLSVADLADWTHDCCDEKPQPVNPTQEPPQEDSKDKTGSEISLEEAVEPAKQEESDSQPKSRRGRKPKSTTPATPVQE